MKPRKEIDILLRHFTALALYNGESPIYDAFLNFHDTVIKPQEDNTNSSNNPEIITKKMAKKLAPGTLSGIGEGLANAANKLIEHLLETQTPVEDIPTEPIEHTETPLFPSYRLILEATKITATHVTDPRDDEDEFALTGGYTHGSSGNGRLNEWQKEFNDGEVEDFMEEDNASPPNKTHRPHILKNVGVPIGINQHFDATIVLLEEDMFTPTQAKHMGTIISLALTAGVEAVIRYITANGLPSNISEAARKALKDIGITGIRSWFEEWVGPETFEIVTLRATTNWPGTDKPVSWRSWIDFAPNTVPTVPAFSIGPNTHVGNDVIFKEARMEENAQGEPIMRVLNDKGQYKIKFQFRVVGSGA